MSENVATYRTAPTVSAEPMATLLATVRACVNRLAVAHFDYGAAECGPEYPRQRNAEFAAAWERLERDVTRERQRVTALRTALEAILKAGDAAWNMIDPVWGSAIDEHIERVIDTAADALAADAPGQRGEGEGL